MREFQLVVPCPGVATVGLDLDGLVEPVPGLGFSGVHPEHYGHGCEHACVVLGRKHLLSFSKYKFTLLITRKFLLERKKGQDFKVSSSSNFPSIFFLE